MSIKRVLITGSNSYVGTNVEKWLMKEPDKFYVETISVRGDAWKSFDFSKFDVVFHVAGIAHVSPKKSMKNLYYSVNRDLAIEVAKKAKTSGVLHFIFMSSMIVYSSKETFITRDTAPNPDNFYGKSKLEAEIGILLLSDSNFKISIIRPPLIYGFNQRGNFNKLRKFALLINLFPDYQNKRSVLYIENLAIFIRYVIDKNKNGLYFPQDREHISTSKIVQSIANFNNKKIFLFRFLNPFISMLKGKHRFLNKIFSDHYYTIKNDILDSYVSTEVALKNNERKI